MKRYSFIILFIFRITDASAQYWATDSSVWHTGILESAFSPAQGFIKTEVVGDTILQGYDCKVLHKTRYYSNGALSNNGDDYMYEDSGKVYHFMNNTFYTLYDFNAMPGDTWTVAVPFPSPWCGISGNSCDTLVKIVVDSVSTITIQSQLLKTQYVHSDSNDWYFWNPIIENIGSVGGIFPFIYGWMDIDLPYLRCYQDSLIFYQTSFPFSAPCDSLISSVVDNELNYQVKVFPNPVTEYLNVISTVPETKIILYDIFSREVMQMSLKNKTNLNLSSLGNGIYFYEIRDKRGVITNGKVIKL